jgi:oxaloacetate decarboxylase (Na+ extruding) subunit alpha
MSRVGIIDTTLRDAHQCLWATRMTTAMMLPVAETMDRIGFDQIDLAGTIQFDVCVRYLKEDPWQRVRLMRERVKRTPLRALIRSKNVLSFDMLPDDINELWTERLIANGFRVVGVFDGLNDVDNMLVGIRKAKALGVRTFGALAFSLSPVHTDELYARTASELIARGGVDAIMLKDSSGLLTPDRLRTLVPALKRVLGNVPLEIHSHCLTALAPLVYLEAVKLGADQLHASIAPLANGPAQPASQTVVRNLRGDGYSIDYEEKLANEVGEHFRQVAEQEGLPLGVPVEYDTFHYEHQMPGGMLSNFQAQLEQAGLGNKFDELLSECGRIRGELGWPIMITPFSQYVGTQAVLNIVCGERYAVVPDEVKKYALGYYGKLLAPIDANVLDRIIENGSNRIALNPVTPEPAVEALRKRYPSASDDERLLRFQIPGPHVDNMLAAGPMRTTYPFECSALKLIEKLSKRRNLGRVYIEKGDTRIEVISKLRQ